MCRPPRAPSGTRAMADVVIVDSGVANLASITSGFQLLGAHVAVTDDPGQVRNAPRVVLPGVGAFGAGPRAFRGQACRFAVTPPLPRAPPPEKKNRAAQISRANDFNSHTPA